MEIKVVIGSWGSYNECNERALGSEWLDFDDYSDWEEIEEELKRQGFELDGIDEELFIQDIMGLDVSNCDYTHPQRLFELIKEAGILEKDYKYKTAVAYIEARSWSDFESLVRQKGSNWDDDIYFHEDKTVEEVLEEMVEECYNLDFKDIGWLSDYITIDYERMARDSDWYTEISNGVLEIR